MLAHLLRADLVPTAHASSQRAREVRLALRERMFYVRLRTMLKNRIVTAFDRYPEQRAALRQYRDLFGAAGRKQLAALEVSAIDRIQIDRGLASIDDIACRIKECEGTIKTLSKGNENVKRLQTLPGIGEFFARLIDAEIDDIARFRSASKLAAYAGLVPSTYSSGGKTHHGRIIKQGNKWLRWAFVEAVAPAVFCDPDVRAFLPAPEGHQGRQPRQGGHRAPSFDYRLCAAARRPLLSAARRHTQRRGEPIPAVLMFR